MSWGVYVLGGKCPGGTCLGGGVLSCHHYGSVCSFSNPDTGYASLSSTHKNCISQGKGSI